MFFDESGQTGCVVNKKDLLNFSESPTFALGAIVVNEQDEKELIKKYLNFKKKFNIHGEIKGNDLLTRENNDKLNYLLRNVFNNVNFYVNIYDKRFYLSTLLLFSFTGLECLKTMKQEIYSQASILSLQDDDFFISYLNYIESPSIESFSKYLSFIINYDYKYFKDLEGNEIENAVIVFAKKIKEEKLENFFWEDFMTYGWYKDDKITNLINLNALYELIDFIKEKLKISNDKISFVHDNISEFEDTIKDEMSASKCNIIFKDSKEEILLQLADNFVSIFRHAYDKSVYYHKRKKLWDNDSLWDLELFSKLQQIVQVNHIKFTVPLQDWASSLCIKDIFSKDYSKKQRNNFIFNYFYIIYLNQINYELFINKKELTNIDTCVKK